MKPVNRYTIRTLRHSVYLGLNLSIIHSRAFEFIYVIGLDANMVMCTNRETSITCVNRLSIKTAP
jgi:hypothetical protein